MLEIPIKCGNDSNILFYPCDYCGRTFNIDALKRHQILCYKVHFKNLVKHYRDSDINTRENKEFVLTSSLLGRKINRRHQWRKEHYQFLRNLSSLNIQKESIVDDVTKFSGYYTSNLQQRNNANRPFKMPQLDKIIPQFKSNSETNLSLVGRYHSKNKRNIQTEKPIDFFQRGSLSKIETKDSNLYEQDPNYNEEFNKSSKSLKYANQVSRVLQHYNDLYWSKENSTAQKVFEVIPNHLSSHKLQLEQFKRLNNQMRQQSDRICEDSGVQAADIRTSEKSDHSTKQIQKIDKPTASYLSDSRRYQAQHDEKHFSITQPNDHHGFESQTKFHVEPFVNKKLDRFKEHYRNMNEANVTLDDGSGQNIQRSVPEEQLPRTEDNCDKTKIREDVDKSSCNARPGNIGVTAPSANENVTNKKINWHPPRPSIHPKHNFPITAPNFNHAKSPVIIDEDYKRAWSVKF